MGMNELLAPYSYIKDPLAGLQQPKPDGGLNNLTQILLSQAGGGQNRGVPLPAGGSGDDIEIIYGGNQFNPTSNDSTHGGHLHFALQRGIVPVGRKLQGLGFDVGEHPKFGGVAPVHTQGSHHYNADAIDVNYNGGGRWNSEQRALNWLEHWLSRRYG